MKKLLPWNFDAETAVLAAILNNQAMANDVFGRLKREDFYLEHYRNLFDATRLLYERGETIDEITVMQKMGPAQVEAFGGRVEVHKIAETTQPDNDALLAYIKIMLDTAAIRRLIKALERSLEICDLSKQSEELFACVLDEIWKSGIQSNSVRGSTAIKDNISPVMSFLETAHTNGEKVLVDGIATKFIDLDRLTGGLHKKDFIILGGRPNMGKTALVTQFALEAAQVGEKVLLFSFEMSRHALILRMLSNMARFDCHKIRTGYFSKDDFRKLAEAAGRICELPIWIEDAPGLGLHEIWTQARVNKNAHDGLDLIIVDTVQLINIPEKDEGKEQTRTEQTSATARGLKYMAQDLNVALVATSQVSRDLEKRKYKKPRLSDLRESGALEEHADVVLFLHREEVYEPTDENAGLAELIVAKQRNGPPGIVKLAFLKEFTRFETLLQFE